MRNIILESVIDATRKTYSPDVFENPEDKNPIIRKDLKRKILTDINRINQIVDVEDYFIKGSILTKQYNKNSDIDVYIQISDIFGSDIFNPEIQKIFNDIDDKKFKDIPYPLQYYITTDVYNFDNTEAAYDIKSDTWIKKAPTKEINIDDYYNEFEEYVNQFAEWSEDLRRNVIDYDILKEIPIDDVKGLQNKIDNKIKDIEENSKDIIELYNKLRDSRNDAFSKEMTPSEIKKYGIKTKLPGNVVFKLIQKYFYTDLAKKLKSIIGNDRSLSEDEADMLNKELKTNLTKEKISFKNLYEKDEFGKPEHRQQSLKAGMIGHGTRKSINVLPDYQRNSGNSAEEQLKKSKKCSNIIRVKKGTPQANYYIQKYRIENPSGEKIVGANQNNPGIKIIFMENNELELNFDDYIYNFENLHIPLINETFEKVTVVAKNKDIALERAIRKCLPPNMEDKVEEQMNLATYDINS